MENIDFSDMYSADNSKKSNDSDFSDDNHEKPSKKDLLIGKRKDKKDKGYATLEGESSPEEEVDTKSPSKSRKTKSFKFPSKKEKREKSREKENKDSEKKKDSDKDKEKKKDKDKLRIKLRKKSKSDHSTDISEELPIFGCPLALAVQRDPCHDGVRIPLVIRNCIDYIQEHGLMAEGVYKVSGVKSRVQSVYGLYNKRKTVYESDFDLTIATSLLKQFLRLLPEPILTKDLLPKFEDVTLTKDASGLKLLVEQLPECNRDLIKWLFVHFRHICSHEKINKMNASLLAAIFCPLLEMTPRLFNSFLAWIDDLFVDFVLTRYVPPMRCVSPNMPTTLESVSCELAKQESLLGQIHFEMNAGFINKEKEDRLWGVQRNITQLKRKLKSLDKEIQQKLKAQESAASLHETDKDEEAETATNASDGSVSQVTEKMNENTRADTTPSVDESSDKQINYESSQENLNHAPSEDSDDEEKALEYESEELINLVKTLQEEIKTERLKINQLKAELSAAKVDTGVSEYLSSLPDELCKEENNREAVREYNRLQIQQKNLLRTIMEERETIIDLKVQISMAQYKYKAPLLNRTKIGGVYSAGGQFIVQEKPNNSGGRKKRVGLFGDPRYVVSKGQPVRGPAQRRQAEIRARTRPNLDWSLEESTEEKDLIKFAGNEKALNNICKGTLNGPIVQWKARRRAQLIPRAKLRAPLPNYQRLQLSYSSEKTEDEHEPRRTRSKCEKRRKPISSIFQMEPQMIRVKEGLSPTSHLHSEKIRISGDAAIFEIKREIPSDGTKFSSRYEIYNSTTKPFGKSYRELTLLSSSTSTSSSCESHTSSLSSSGLSETTTYITCNSEIEPVQMTGFQCIDETRGETHIVSVLNEENYDRIHEATNYDINFNNKSAQDEEIVPEKKYSTFYRAANPVILKVTDDDDGKPIIKTNTWSSRTEEPLKSPKLLKQMISNFEHEYKSPKSSTKTTYQEEEYTYEPEHDASISQTVTRCRSMMNLDVKPDQKDDPLPPIISKATSDLDLQRDKDDERKRIIKTISVLLENRRRQKPEPVKPTAADINANDKLVNDNIILIESANNRDRSCRVTGEILKNSPQPTYQDYHRAACTLPRIVKSHRSQLQRHFYYPQYVGKGTRVRDEELPDPDKVKSARELFERVLKLGSLENVSHPKSTTLPKTNRPTPEIRQPADAPARQKLQKCLSVDTSHPEAVYKWTDNGSLSSGVGSDISAETDMELSPKGTNSSDCGSKDDITFTSEEDLSDPKDSEELGKPVSAEILRNIRAFGTSVTYYGGKVIATSKGYTRSPMTMTIMNEIKQSSPESRKFLFDDKQLAKFKLIKSNSCGSRLELSGTDEYAKEYDRKSNGIADEPKVEIKREPEPIEEEEEPPAEKSPTAKERITAFESKNEQSKNWYKHNLVNGHAKPYLDMEFEEFEVLEDKS